MWRLVLASGLATIGSTAWASNCATLLAPRWSACEVLDQLTRLQSDEARIESLRTSSRLERARTLRAFEWQLLDDFVGHHLSSPGELTAGGVIDHLEPFATRECVDHRDADVSLAPVLGQMWALAHQDDVFPSKSLASRMTDHWIESSEFIDAQMGLDRARTRRLYPELALEPVRPGPRYRDYERLWRTHAPDAFKGHVVVLDDRSFRAILSYRLETGSRLTAYWSSPADVVVHDELLRSGEFGRADRGSERFDPDADLIELEPADLYVVGARVLRDNRVMLTKSLENAVARRATPVKVVIAADWEHPLELRVPPWLVLHELMYAVDWPDIPAFYVFGTR